MLALVSAFCLSGSSSKDPPGGYVALQPLGEVDDRLLETLRKFVEGAYAMPCTVMKRFDLPSTAYDAARKQYRANELLSFLMSHSPRGASKVVGVTEKDITTGQMNFIFGLADLRGRSCVVSVCRLHESFWGKREKDTLLYRRALKVLYHELGHTFGMRHCDKIECAMCYHNSLPELDVSYVWFCPASTRELERRAKPFPQDRDAKLAALLTQTGLVNDAKRYTEKKGAKH